MELVGGKAAGGEGGDEGAGARDGFDAEAGGDRLGDDAGAGVGDAGGAGVGDEGDLLPAPESVEDLGGAAGLVEAEVAEEGFADLEVLEELAGAPGILGGDDIAFTQDAEGAKRDVLEVSDGGGDEVERSRGERGWRGGGHGGERMGECGPESGLEFPGFGLLGDSARVGSMIRELRDSHGRVMRDLRVSVTDRCNFRCLYCLPETEEAANFYRTRWQGAGRTLPEASPIRYEWKPKAELLSYEEIERVARVAVSMGVEKLRVTGGEPLLRRGLEGLVGRLAGLPGVADLAMTTNGFLFGSKAAALKAAGLHRVSFSLDSLDPENFRRMTGRDGLQEVLDAIALAQSLGFSPVKVNAVVIRGMNDHELEGLVRFGRERGLEMRFIEFMPLDSSRAWQRDLVVTGREILERLRSGFEMVPADQSGRSSETARRWRFADGRGEIGIIAPVSEPFCGHCNRLRLTADGKIRTCLFSIEEHDLRPLLRGGASDEDLAMRLVEIVRGKEAGHRIGKPDFVQPARSMSCIGG